MFKIMTTKSFNEAVDKALQREMVGAGQSVRKLRLEKQMLEAEIEAMKPDFELGKKRRAAYEADNAKRKAARAKK